MAEPTTLPLELNLEESGILYHLLLGRLMVEERSSISAVFNNAACTAIRRRQTVLLLKIASVNDQLQRV